MDINIMQIFGNATLDMAAAVRAERDAKINAIAWRVERYHRQVRMGITPTDDISVLDTCVQALCDVPEQDNFPYRVAWPEIPELKKKES
jgi:hypothetical protein